jgi:hypothetical protein
MSCVRSDIETGTGKPRRRDRPALRVVGATTRVVIADADSARRASVLDDLTQTMSENTTFLEAATVAELLEHAPGSRTVIIGGTLDDIPARSLIRILAQRHPHLQVINLEMPAQTDS